jgi:hypothetical protein
MKRPEELEPDHAAAQAFLDALAGKPRASFTFQTFDDDPARTRARQAYAEERKAKLKDPYRQVLHGILAEWWPRLSMLNHHGAGIFVTVAGFGTGFDDIYPTPRAGLRAVWCSGVPEREWPLPPHITVETAPGRYDYYWLLKPGQCRWEQHRAIMRRMVRLHGCDPSRSDPATALRVPGFLTWGNGEPFLVRTCGTDMTRYELSEILLALGADDEEPLGARGNDERRQILERVSSFIDQQGDSRFSDADAAADSGRTIRINRAGWWRDGEHGRVYLFNSAGMREALKGHDFKQALDILQEAGALPKTDASGRRAPPHRIGGRVVRLYCIAPSRLEVEHRT